MLVSNHSIRLGSLNAIVRSTLPLESKTRISPARKHARVSALGDGLTFLREHRLNARSFKNLSPPSVRSDFNDCHCGAGQFASSAGVKGLAQDEDRLWHLFCKTCRSNQ